MRTKLIFLLLLCCNYISGQNALVPTVKDSLKNTTKKYLFDKRKKIDSTARPALVTAYKIAEAAHTDPANATTLKAKNDAFYKLYRFYNPKMLNILFADEVATYFNGGSDLSLQKYYSSIDADDTSITFGVNFDIRDESKLERLKWLFSVGFKAKATEKFSTFVKNGKLENTDLGLTGKVTLIGRGIINFTDKSDLKRGNIIENYRTKLLKKHDTKIDNYLTTDYPKQLDSLNTIYDDINNTNTEETNTKMVQKFIKEKYYSFYEKIATEEVKFLKDNKLYRYLWDHWGTVDFFIPIGEKEYKYSTSVLTDITPHKTNFYPLKITGTYTNMFKWSSGQSLYMTGQIGAFNNNNALVDEITATPFQTITTQSPTQQAVTNSDDVYVLAGGFNRFITGVTRFEIVFFVKPWIGISPAIEKNFGQYYHKLNWKLGVPFSLKDKDGKPSINFEVQWKELNNDHLVGISASFLFGKFLK